MRRARFLLADGMVCYSAGVLLVSAPWRLGGNFDSLIHAIQVVLASIVLSLLSGLVPRMVRTGLHAPGALLAALIALGIGWLAISAGAYTLTEYGDARYWSARGADIRPEATAGIGLCGLSAVVLAASSALELYTVNIMRRGSRH
jgi:hypothetical protein